jgi:GMP synthase-like glutamine amidotransferase
VLQHVVWEDSGIAGEVFERSGADVKVVRLFDGGRIPIVEVGRGEFDCVFGLGSPSTAYLPETNPNHDSEVALMKILRMKRIPSFNICYSMQLFSVANGGKVEKNPNGKEVGFRDVTLTDRGRNDVVARNFRRTLQWHGDIVSKLPEGAVLLGSSEMTENQIAVVDGIHHLVQGDGAATRPATLSRWIEEDGGWAFGGLESAKTQLMDEAEKKESEYADSFTRALLAFLDLVSVSRSQSLDRL